MTRRRGGAKRKPDRAQPQEKFGAEPTTPSAPLKGGFAASFLMSRPPLLFKEGKRVQSLTPCEPLDMYGAHIKIEVMQIW
jgi:hypothetical protein